MATIINLDGFPKVASEAIEFSYFLSESEKAEWREWLKTATPEQQEELVDILYSMWQDNQKNAVPENLANNQNLNTNNTQPLPPFTAPVKAFPTPAPQFQQPQTNLPPIPSFPTNNSPFPEFNTNLNSAPTFGQPVQANNSFASNPVLPAQPSFTSQGFSAQTTQPPQIFPTPAPQFQQPPINPTLPQAPSFAPSTPAFNPEPVQVPTFKQPTIPDNLVIQDLNTPLAAAPSFVSNSNQQTSSVPSAELFPQPPLQPVADPVEPTPSIEKPSFVPSSDDIDTQSNSFNTPVAAPTLADYTPIEIKPIPTLVSEPVAALVQEPAVKPEPIEAKIEEPVKTTISEIAETSATILPPQTQDISFDFEDEEKTEETPAVEPVKPEIETKKTSDISMESLVNDNKYRPNPILDSNSDNDEDSEFIFKKNIEPKNTEKTQAVSTKTNQSKLKSDEAVDNEDYDFTLKQTDSDKNSKFNSKKSQNKKNEAIKFTSLKDPGTKDMLNEIYNDYIETYDSNQKKFVLFLDRVTKVLSNYETISVHFENLTSKVVDINDKIVSQAVDIQALKDATRTQSGTSIQEQIDDLRFDLDNVEKDVRSLRTESRRKTSEISQKMAAVGADSYGDGGVIQKIELLKSEINNLKQQMAAKDEKATAPTSATTSGDIPTKTSKLDLTGII